MTFMITLIALLMERFFHWHHFRKWRWFIKYEQWLSDYSVRLPDVLRLILSLTPPLMIVGIINYLFSGVFWGLFEFVFGTLVLLYCLGPDNLWVQGYRCIEGFRQEDPQYAMDQAKKSFGVANIHDSQDFHKELVRAIFIAAHERIFSVVFWFVVLGPLGAVLYRLVELFSVHQELGLTEVASKAKKILDWLPLRIFTFIFALGGHFKEVFACWKSYINKGVISNEVLLGDCGLAALDVMEGGKIPETGEAEKEAIELLDRVFAMVLVFLAIIVIIF